MFRLTFRLVLASLFFTLFISLNLRAEVILVTSNADAGAGTLRAALTRAAANGITEKDFIHFSLPDQSEAGRTITLLNQLPNVSSNLDIDGSTQAGNVFGRSTAKVQLVAAFTYQDRYYGLNLENVSDIGIYGLYIRNVTVFNTTSGIFFERVVGISLNAAKNIRIGDVGKGNVVCGFYRDLSSNIRIGAGLDTFVENLSMKSNFIGVEADGKTEYPRINSLQTSNANMQNLFGLIEIGDGTPAGQNVIVKGINIHQYNTGQYADPIYSTPAFINFRYNIIGNNLDLNVPDNLAANEGIRIVSSAPYTLSTIKIEDNILGGGSAISLSGIQDPVEIKRNYIGVDRSLKKVTIVHTGIFIYYVKKVNIGSNDIVDANFIGYCKPVNVWPNTSASINKNSFFCAINAYPMILDAFNMRTLPKIEITSATTNTVMGTATPNSTVELFYSDLCGTCSPETYFASTTTDAAGNWEYTGPVLRSVVASATLNGITSEFTRTRVDVTGIRVTNTCGNTGSIIGALPLSASYVEWLDVSGNVVGRGKDLLNVPIGTYRLKAVNGDCSEITPWYEVRKSMEVNTSNVQITNSACGVGGGIRGVQLTNRTTGLIFASWKNALGTEVGTALALTNVPAGTYTLTLRTADNSCTETHGPFTVTNVSGPNISLSALNITVANCGANTGSITGITATGSGTLTYRWKNENGAQVGTTKDLINQRPGRYVLEVTDQSSCGVVSTSPITILEANGITINDTQKQIFNPTCVGNNGSIKNLQITGATSYTWKNSSGQTVGSQANLEGMPPGNYQLTASNPFCSKTYDLNLTAQPNLINFQGITNIVTDASCGLNNGKIIVTLQNVVHPPKRFRWQDQAGRTVGGNTAVLENVAEGAYRIYGIDDNGCEIYLITYNVNRQPQLALITTNYRVTHDQCNQNLGSIAGLQLNGGVAPYTYKWTNEAGVQVGNTLAVNNLSKGNYTLQITDALNCSPLVSNFTVNNQSRAVVAPIVAPIQLCAPGEATLRVNGAVDATSYALYASEAGVIPIEVVTNGVFKIEVASDKSYFVTQRVGNCESQKVAVKVTVGLSGLTMANTFTPNNDGINDIWNLKGIENYPQAHIQIFNRAGSKVYETIGYERPFDGTYNGVVIPVGVYYYIIKLGAACELVTGALTIIR